MFFYKEADFLAKKALNETLKKGLCEARILKENKGAKLYFFFKNDLFVNYFLRNKENIKQNLRKEYAKKLELYKKMDFVFNDIDAKNIDEARHRSAEEMKSLEYGLAKMEKLINSMKGKRK